VGRGSREAGHGAREARDGAAGGLVLAGGTIAAVAGPLVLSEAEKLNRLLAEAGFDLLSAVENGGGGRPKMVALGW
jgi:hypothetical protein